jgi:hypothetical protein
MNKNQADLQFILYRIKVCSLSSTKNFLSTGSLQLNKLGPITLATKENNLK